MTVHGSCHCGAVTITLPPPTEIAHCNCSLCRKYGVLWAYYEMADVTIGGGDTHTYAWNGKNVDFHRCVTCGCVTHWHPRDPKRKRLGINARLLDPAIVAKAAIVQEDMAGTGVFF